MVERTLTGGSMRRSTERGLGQMFAILLLVAAAYWLVAWPWLLIRDHGGGRLSAGLAEVAYAGVVGAVVWASRLSRNKAAMTRHRTPGWRQMPADPPGLRRWWDGSQFTSETQWVFDAVRPEGSYFTHGSCTVRHRSYGAAARCNGGV